MVPNFQIQILCRILSIFPPRSILCSFSISLGRLTSMVTSTGLLHPQASGWVRKMGSTNRNRRKQKCSIIDFTSFLPVTSEITCVPNGSLFLSTPSSPQEYSQNSLLPFNQVLFRVPGASPSPFQVRVLCLMVLLHPIHTFVSWPFEYNKTKTSPLKLA